MIQAPLTAGRIHRREPAAGSRLALTEHALVLGLVVLVAVLTGLHLVSLREGPAWTSPLLIGDHLFDLMLATAILWYALATGRRLGAALPAGRGDALSDGLAALGLGLGTLSLGILGLGLLHLYYGPAFIAAALLLTIWLRNELATTLRSACGGVARWLREGMPSAPTRTQRMAVLILALALLPLWVESTLPAGSGPIMEWDAPAYHLAGPKLFLAAHAVVPLPDVPLANAPSGLEMFYVPGLMLETDGLGRALNLWFVVLLVLATFALGRRHLHPAAGWLAALLVGNVLWLVPEAPSTLNDFAAAFLLVVGFGDILTWLEGYGSPQRHGGTEAAQRDKRGRMRPDVLGGKGIRWNMVAQWRAGAVAGVLAGSRGDWLLLRGGLLLGLSASFKMVNVPVIPALPVTVGVFLLVRGRQGVPRRLVRGIWVGCLIGAGAAAALAPWLLKNLAFFGHPLYPLSVAVSYTAGAQTSSAAAAPSMLDHVRWTVESLLTVCGSSLGVPGVLLLAAPLVLRGRAAEATMLFLVLGGVFWLWVVPLYGEPRYYIGLIAIAAAAAAAALCRGLDRIGIRQSLGELPVAAYLLAHSVLMLCLAGLQMVDDRAPSVLAGAVSRDAYLAAHVGPYLAEQYVNAHTPPGSMIAAVHTTLSYYLDRPHLGDWYSSRRLALERGGEAEKRELAAWCRAGVRYALINRGDDHDAAFGLPMPVSLAWLREPALHARVLYSANDTLVAALTPCRVGAPGGAAAGG